MDPFTAKDVQRILQIPKHRYEYLASKIGITPDLEEVEGSGRSHRYSFRNLLQFASVHSGNALGLSPKAARRMLSFVEEWERWEKTGLFDPKKPTKLSLHYVMHGPLRYFLADLPGAKLKLFPDWQFDAEALKYFNKEIAPLSGKQKMLRAADGYMTLNFKQIKKRVIEAI